MLEVTILHILRPSILCMWLRPSGLRSRAFVTTIQFVGMRHLPALVVARTLVVNHTDLCRSYIEPPNVGAPTSASALAVSSCSLLRAFRLK